MTTFAPIPMIDAKGVCRFCGCTEFHPCDASTKFSYLKGCRWLDNDQTACDALLCAEEALKALRVHRVAIHVTRCLCQSFKRKGWAFCYRCNKELPWALRGALMDGREVEAALAYADATRFLAERTNRLKGRTA